MKELDPSRIRSATERAQAYTDDTIKRVQEYLIEDKYKIKRYAAVLCKWCWYRRSCVLAGQMITEYTCQRCEQQYAHSDTNVPALCDPCAITISVCRGCCAGNRK